jgi:hypothetical protein
MQPTAQPSFNPGRLNQDFQARQRGQMRTQNFQRAQGSPAFRPSGPSSGFARPSGGGGGGFGGGGGGPRGGGGGGRGGRR